MLLGHMVGQFCQSFGRPNAHAHRNARPLHHALAHGVTHFTQIGCARKVDKAFVNGIHLGARRVLAQNLHHAVGQVGIQSVVAAECKHAVLRHQVFALKPRLSHAHTQSFGLVGARDHTAIVVRQHHHGHVAQVGPKQSFATDVEVVAIDQSQLLSGRLCGRTHDDVLQAGEASIQLVQVVSDYAPNAELLATLHQNGWVQIVFGHELDHAAAPVQTLHGELVVEHGQHNVVVLGFNGPVDDQRIAFVNTGTHHGVALHFENERGLFVANKVVIQVNAFLGVVGRGRGKASGHFPGAHVEPQLGAGGV